MKVAKNRLAKIALEGTDVASIGSLLKGPTLIAYSGDPIAAPKVAADFAKTHEKFVILGGAMGKTALDPNGVKALAALPSLDELRAKIVGLIRRRRPRSRRSSTPRRPRSPAWSRPMPQRAKRGCLRLPANLNGSNRKGHMHMADLQKIVDDLSSLTVLEAAELAKLLEEKWGVSAAAAVAVAAGPAAVALLPLRPRRRPSSRSFWPPPATRRSRSSRKSARSPASA